MKVYLVSGKNGEFVGFTDPKDARYAATGNTSGCFGVSTLGDAFRDAYADGVDDSDDDDDCPEFPIIEIELTPDQIAKAEIKT